VERGMDVVASYPKWHSTPIVLGESDPEGCAACQGPQNGYRNGPLYGVSVAEATSRTWELARKHDVRVMGAVTWAFTFENQPYFAGFRELATNGVDKAVLNVFSMMAMLGGDWVRTESSGALPVEQIVTHSVTDAPDVDAIATRRMGEVDVLLWNYHDADVPSVPAKLEIKVRGLPVAQLTEQVFLMDAAHSNAYAVWQRMGSPAKPTAEQQQDLVAAGKLERVMAPHAIATKNGVAAFQMSLARQGVALVRLRWE
jgi:xylan 1,4-beta-xylosidase